MRLSRHLHVVLALAAGVALAATALVPASGPRRSTGVVAGPTDQGGLKARFVNEPSYTPPMPSDLGGAPAATISVTYTGFTAASQAAFQRAVDIWAGIITSSVPIRVSATMTQLNTNVLGSAGSNFSWRDFSGAPRSGTWYPDALADKLAGSDRNPGDFDIVARFTTDPSINWYFGTDGHPGANQFDFVSVVLHELGHGLGFFGRANVSGGTGTWGSQGFPYIYDRFVKNGSGQGIIGFTSGSAELAAQLLGNNLYWYTPAADGGPISSPARLYAPSAWESGSSYSHLDESTYVSGNANSLMTPQISQMEAIHDPGTVTREIFADMGWTVGSTTPAPGGTPGTPANVQVAVNGTTSLTVTWTAPATGATPTSYRVDFAVTPGGAAAAQVASTTTSATVNIPSGTTGTFYATVTALVGTTAGTASAPVAFTIGGSGPCTVPATPAGITGAVSGGVAHLQWGASAGATSYVVQAGTSQGASNLFNGNVGASTTASAPVGAGFQAFVRVFAVNACGSSAPTADFVLGLTLGEGDLQVTLSWDAATDMDLHVIEPDGTHVYYAARTGHTARLDLDDTSGFGPENIFVNRGAAAAGVYQVFVVQYSSSTPTNSTIQIRLNAGAANERYAVFTRATPGGNSHLGFDVADVDILNGTITERAGTRAALAAGEADAPSKRP